jgi:hypothetical protein
VGLTSSLFQDLLLESRADDWRLTLLVSLCKRLRFRTNFSLVFYLPSGFTLLVCEFADLTSSGRVFRLLVQSCRMFAGHFLSIFREQP